MFFVSYFLACDVFLFLGLPIERVGQSKGHVSTLDHSLPNSPTISGGSVASIPLNSFLTWASVSLVVHLGHRSLKVSYDLVRLSPQVDITLQWCVWSKSLLYCPAANALVVANISRGLLELMLSDQYQPHGDDAPPSLLDSKAVQRQKGRMTH